MATDSSEGVGEWRSVRRKSDKVRLLRRYQGAGEHAPPDGTLVEAVSSSVNQKDEESCNIQDLIGSPIVWSAGPVQPGPRPLWDGDKDEQALTTRRAPGILVEGNCNAGKNVDAMYSPSTAAGLPSSNHRDMSLEEILQVDSQDWPTISIGSVVTMQTTESAWSEAVRKPAQPRKKMMRGVAERLDTAGRFGVYGQGEVDANDQNGEAEEEQLPKKKHKKKKVKGNEASVRREPLMLELDAIFQALELKQSKKVVVGAGATALAKQQPQQHSRQHHREEQVGRGNVLDSSAPAVRRGKEREQPKKKRPTALRRVITREKQERKRDQPNPTSVDQFQQGPTSVDQFQQGPTSVDQFQQGTASLNQFEQGPTSVDQFQQGPTSVDQFQQGPTSVDQFQQGQTSVHQFQQGQTSVDQFQQGQTSVDQSQQGLSVDQTLQGLTSVDHPQRGPSMDQSLQCPTSIDQFLQGSTSVDQSELELMRRYPATSTPAPVLPTISNSTASGPPTSSIPAPAPPTSSTFALALPTISSSTDAQNSLKKSAFSWSDKQQCGDVIAARPKQLHNKKFREYCDQLVTDDINNCAERLLSSLMAFQDKQFLKDPTKAKTKRRYVCGLREVLKHLKLKRLKCLVIAPNLDRVQSEGGIYDYIDRILQLCKEQDVPVIFAMTRRRLATLLHKKQKLACVGVFYYDGAESHFKELMKLVGLARQEYSALHENSPSQDPLLTTLLPSSDEQLPCTEGAPNSSTTLKQDSAARQQYAGVQNSSTYIDPVLEALLPHSKPALDELSESHTAEGLSESHTAEGLMETHTAEGLMESSRDSSASHQQHLLNVHASEFKLRQLNIEAPVFMPVSK